MAPNSPNAYWKSISKRNCRLCHSKPHMSFDQHSSATTQAIKKPHTTESSYLSIELCVTQTVSPSLMSCPRGLIDTSAIRNLFALTGFSGSPTVTTGHGQHAA